MIALNGLIEVRFSILTGKPDYRSIRPLKLNSSTLFQNLESDIVSPWKKSRKKEAKIMIALYLSRIMNSESHFWQTLLKIAVCLEAVYFTILLVKLIV